MKVNEFIKKALEVEKMPTLYKLGKFMNSYQQGKRNKYLLCDCSGLIKGILWGYPENGHVGNQGVPDINANTMINYCTNVSSDFSKIEKGELVWLKDHIGIYIGNHQVCECSPSFENGIQITRLSQRKWKKHGKFKYIDYSNSNSNVNNSSRLDINKVVNDIIDGKFGNGHETRKKAIENLGLNYEEVRRLVNQKLKG